MEIEFTIIIHPEDTPVRGNAMASGDDAFDREVEDAIIADLDSGNEWAWCTVEVRASLADDPDVNASDFLGACSFRDESDFRNSGYFEDMRKEAADLLAQRIARIVAAAR